MMCKGKSKMYFIVLLVVGVVSLVFGILSTQFLNEDAHNLSMLSGMFTGLGGAFIAIGVGSYIKNKISSPEKLRSSEIERTDERNVQVLRASYSVASAASYVIFAVMAFVFVWLDYIIPAFITIGGMYLEIIIFFIAYRRLNQRM